MGRELEEKFKMKHLINSHNGRNCSGSTFDSAFDDSQRVEAGKRPSFLGSRGANTAEPHILHWCNEILLSLLSDCVNGLRTKSIVHSPHCDYQSHRVRSSSLP